MRGPFVQNYWWLPLPPPPNSFPLFYVTRSLSYSAMYRNFCGLILCNECSTFPLRKVYSVHYCHCCQNVMAKLESIELIFMDVFSRKRTPPLPTESTLRSQLAYSQIHILPSVPEPSVLLQSSTSQLHLPSESPAPVFLPASHKPLIMNITHLVTWNCY